MNEHLKSYHARLEAVSMKRCVKVDWLALEQFQRDAMGDRNLTDSEKLILLADSIGEWTGRGFPVLNPSEVA